MDSDDSQETYPSISHRVASAYPKFLASYPSGALPGGEGDERARRDLHSFFSAFYAKLYQQPDLFGLPLKEDDSIPEDEPHEKDKKQEVTAKMKAPKELIARGLDFLAQAGKEGQLVEQDLHLEQGSQLVKQTKVGRKFLQGLQSAGLEHQPENDRIILRSSQFPAMMAAMQELARACAQYSEPHAGFFHFARCDFRALQPGYCPAAMDLYRDFAGADLERVTRLHEYFSSMGYRAISGVHDPFYWIVQYQGDRKIKATPLLQIDYSDRHQHPLHVSIKCASTNRIAGLLPHQPQALLDDFMRRVNPCRGDECGWCRNNKNLGPTTLEYQGEEKVLCWYSFPDVRHFNDSFVELLQAYARLHAELQPA